MVLHFLIGNFYRYLEDASFRGEIEALVQELEPRREELKRELSQIDT
jgi:hypothetical protein